MKVKKLFENDEHLPIKYMCSYCKKIKNEKEEYVKEEIPDLKKFRISHGICPECKKEIWDKE
jgi:hypothetical protein